MKSANFLSENLILKDRPISKICNITNGVEANLEPIFSLHNCDVETSVHIQYTEKKKKLYSENISLQLYVKVWHLQKKCQMSGFKSYLQGKVIQHLSFRVSVAWLVTPENLVQW